MSLRFLAMEAAILFGVPLDEFLAKPLQRRSEMMAHVIVRGERSGYVEDMMTRWAKKKGKEPKGGFNPLELMHRSWGLKEGE